MRKVLIISDTHSNFTLMKQVFKIEKDYDTLIHLGDEHDDIEFFSEEIDNKQVYTVAGLYHHDYGKKSKTCINIKINNWSLQLAHSPNNLELKQQNAELYLHGHTHQAKIEQNPTFLVLNPGHLKSKKDRGFYPSYMVLEFQNNDLIVRLKDINGKDIKVKNYRK